MHLTREMADAATRVAGLLAIAAAIAAAVTTAVRGTALAAVASNVADLTALHPPISRASLKEELRVIHLVAFSAGLASATAALALAGDVAGLAAAVASLGILGALGTFTHLAAPLFGQSRAWKYGVSGRKSHIVILSRNRSLRTRRQFAYLVSSLAA
ncbi:hypothetical protein L209DRAFT_93849 [Thermothelomyces heterothallicus CBS 203.75]